MNRSFSDQQYCLIREAIIYINRNFKNQPKLEQIARYMGISSSYFQKMFTQWAGVSPKQFSRFLTLEYAKHQLRNAEKSVLQASIESGFSSGSRFYDACISFEAMTPGQYKSGGKSLTISYSYAQSLFGLMILASTERGLCFLAFSNDRQSALEQLQCQYPQAKYVYAQTDLHQRIIHLLSDTYTGIGELKVHIQASPFQMKVWKALLAIPFGQLVSYGMIAKSLDMPKAARAVGNAIGTNPISFLIPCHRVIRENGLLGNYRWDPIRKQMMIAWEATQIYMEFS